VWVVTKDGLEPMVAAKLTGRAVVCQGVRALPTGFDAIVSRRNQGTGQLDIVRVRYTGSAWNSETELSLPYGTYVALSSDGKALAAMHRESHRFSAYRWAGKWEEFVRAELPRDVKLLAWSPQCDRLAGFGGEYLWLIRVLGESCAARPLEGEWRNAVAVWRDNNTLIASQGSLLWEWTVDGGPLRELWSVSNR
jgi:hypothetical protein